MLPGVVKTASSYLLHHAGLDNWELFSKRRRMPVVLGYHRVVEDFRSSACESIPSLLISSEMFERHLDLLCKQYQIISVDELARSLENGQEFVRPAAVITFDDGYRDVYENAFPILRRKGISATVFAIADIVGTSKTPIHDQVYHSLLKLYKKNSAVSWTLAELLRGAGVHEAAIFKILSQSKDPYSTTRALLVSLPQEKVLSLLVSMRGKLPSESDASKSGVAMTWEMLSEMRRYGCTIGSHTRTHAVLANENKETVADELRSSRQILESHLGTQVHYLAYPDGRFDRETLYAAQAAGYRCAFTTCRHQDTGQPQLTIPRVVLWENSWVDCRSNLSESIMTCQLNGLFDVINRCTQDHRLPANRVSPNFEIQHAEQQS
jgi:peptidoglycan/xylan/chitin deacetylase (PgdA/CDA1 family)